MKRCPSCGETKTSDEFGRNRSLSDGLSFYCRACNRARSNEHYRKRRAALGKQVRDLSWVPDGYRWCPTCEQAVPVEDYIRNAAAPSGFGGRCKPCHNTMSKDAYWIRQYGLTRADVDDLRDEQGDVCGICGERKPEHLDHDHSTGKVRQLLCQRCNHLFRDDPALLRAAADYVEFHTLSQRLVTLAEAAGLGHVRPIRPGAPPVGSNRRPETQSNSSRSTGRTSRSRRRQQAGEADG